jgi:C1A family cysteine protease
MASSYRVRESAVVAGEGEFVHIQDWNRLISDYVNARNIVLNVDGKTVNLKKERLYMDESLNLMIPASVLTDAFSCAYNLYDNSRIVIEKGTIRIEANVGEEEYSVNEQDKPLECAPVMLDGEVYIPAKMVENGLEYTYNWNIENVQLSYVNTGDKDNILPYQYDYRLDGRSPLVKDQGVYGTCWAFAALMALESSLLPEEDYDFSEENMVLNSGYQVGMYDGGEYTMSMAYLASWRGPVLESEDAYGDSTVNEAASVVKHVQEIQIIEAKNFEAIKKAVFFYGGVQSSLYTSLVNSNSYSVYYNRENAAYCYIGPNKANHDVVIIGWDDNYPKENFNTDVEGNGAFICQNSWGTGFGDEGVFYVSYYDSNIGLHNIVYTGIEETDNFDNIYQSDICGWVGQMGYEDPEAFFANVYTAEGNESLEAVSFYATGKSTEYEIFFVEEFTDAKSLNKRTSITTGTLANAGYYTIRLDEPLLLSKGQKYAVVVRIKTPNAVYPIAVEYRVNKATASVDLSDGEGYISLKGRTWEHVEETKECNICLKVFTNNR